MCFITLQFSLQDNGSAKYFQGAMHTPNMGEKVAQVSESFLYYNYKAILRESANCERRNR